MASAAITSNPQPLATTSHSRQNHLSSRSFSSTAGGYENPEAQAPHPNMSFSMSQGSQGSALMPQSSGPFRQYDGGNNGLSRRDPAPQIYSAVYSGVDVYEMEVNNVAVMRRRKDSWLNATQILKVAGIEKGKRTKVLEKEILIGEHEKVQGGYGKYQGTWIKFERGLEFCRQYGVEEILRPLLTYDMGQDGGVAGRGGIDTPTKEQAMAAQRKRMYSSGAENRSGGQSGTFFKNISSTASHAVAAISKARFDSPVPRMRNGTAATRPPSFNRQSSSQHLGSQEAAFPGGSQQSMQSFASNDSFNANGDSAYATQYSQALPDDMRNGDFEEPPRKRIRPSPNENDQQLGAYYDQSMRDGSPTEPNESFFNNSQRAQGDEANIPLPPIDEASIPDFDQKKRLLMTLFSEPSQSDFSNHEVFRTLSSQDLDIPIDNTFNTPLIWAATLARIPLLKALVAAGASPNRVNRSGETALMRSCAVTNNLDMGTFTDILELLSTTINFTDARNRTVLHHIALTSAVKGRSSASKYYLESLLEFVVRQGTAPNSQTSFGNGARPVDSMNLGRFMSEVVNIQDKSGDTALNIAARIGNASIINQLLEVGADNKLRNNSGLAPYDFNIGDPPNIEPQSARIPAPDNYTSRTKESSTDIISSISSLVSDAETEFAREMEAKQVRIDTLHAQLRESSAMLGEQRRRVEALQENATEQSTRKLKIENLSRAVNEERSKLQDMQRRMGQVNGEVEMQLGDADKGLALPAGAAPANVLANINPNPHQPPLLDQAQRQLLSSLPPTHVLRARVNAYKANNQALQEDVRSLEGKSSELAAKYRKIISLCTGTENVDDLAEALVRATESDADVELPRIRDFLQRVDGSS
ncbi:Start control protein cdc10 [Lachnellula suecica]|uniref:Transcription factor SWI6 n=1 Tax=Lachnellula suecica TaxID=602035 RepID=A0A8T9BTU9_9HELO|nr:Start control protein cdc10 [Lachnellula suecica]